MPRIPKWNRSRWKAPKPGMNRDAAPMATIKIVTKNRIDD
jgi:hypothetical protein